MDTPDSPASLETKKPQAAPATPKQDPTPNREKSPQEKTQTPQDYKTLEEKYMLLQADFVNYEKRLAKERREWLMRANETLLQLLLPVLNDFQRALTATAPSNPAETFKGLSLIYKKLLTLLKKQGVTPIQIAEGQEIKNEHHVEVVSTLPVSDPKKKGRIIQVVAQGYLYHARVLQRAKVIIGQ